MNIPRTLIVRRESGPTANLATTPLLQRIYAARGVSASSELSHRLHHMNPPAALKNSEAAAELLETALRQRWRIVIVADLDADGATSCALALRALRALGATAVDYVVPNRFVHGYGLTPEIVAVAAEKSPDLLITVDNGISNHDGVQAAQARGIKVLITDHHLPGLTVPAADVVVNPKQPGDESGSENLAGVGVIFYVLSALRARLRASGWFAGPDRAEPNMAQFLDLVALGTVADVVRLDHTNRILVAQGLQRIRAGHCVPGIQALLDIAKRDAARLSAIDLGFQLGPRLNAAGRLVDMRLSIECLLSDDPAEAKKMAEHLDELNRERRVIEDVMQKQALARLEGSLASGATLPFGLCLFDPEWHQGVVGIVAGRVKEQLHRPVIAFAPDHAAGLLRGSARSVDDLHIRDALATIAAQQPGLITRFGGHAAAAGLSLPAENLEAFRAAFDAEVRRWLSVDHLQGRLLSDGELSVAELCLETAELLRAAGPWGQGFPEPLFDGEFEVLSHQIMQDRHVKLYLRPPGSTLRLEGVAFRRAAEFVPGTDRLRIAYKLDVNEWRGQRRLQLVIEHLEPVLRHAA